MKYNLFGIQKNFVKEKDDFALMRTQIIEELGICYLNNSSNLTFTKVYYVYFLFQLIPIDISKN